jgi:hypothetical protein
MPLRATAGVAGLMGVILLRKSLLNPAMQKCCRKSALRIVLSRFLQEACPPLCAKRMPRITLAKSSCSIEHITAIESVEHKIASLMRPKFSSDVEKWVAMNRSSATGINENSLPPVPRVSVNWPEDAFPENPHHCLALRGWHGFKCSGNWDVDAMARELPLCVRLLRAKHLPSPRLL